MGKLATVVTALCTAAGCKAKGKAEESTLEKQNDTMAGSAMGGTGQVWLRADGPAHDPRVAGFIQWVHALGSTAQPDCSITQLDDRAMLTAAHCVDGGVDPSADDGAIHFSDLACAFGPCDLTFPEGDISRIPEDVAVLWSPLPVAHRDPIPLAHVEGLLHGVVMVSASGGGAFAMCRAIDHPGIGDGTGTVVYGDSGSPIMGLTASGPVVLGVVSHREEHGDGWYFAVTPLHLPWPHAAQAAENPPAVTDGDPGLIPISDCP